MNKQTCFCCGASEGMIRFEDRTFAVTYQKLQHNVSGLAGWECTECAEVEFDADSAIRYAKAGDQLIEDAKQAVAVSDYEECLADHRRLVRELDVLLNGEDGAAPQASLCDIVGQVSSIVREEGLPLLSAFSARKYAPERVSVPEQWQDKLTRLHPTIQHGKWPKSWQDDAKQQELDELRALLSHAEGGKV